MSTITALTPITTAFNILNVFMPGDTIPSTDQSTALTFLNGMMGQWVLETGTIPVTSREVFPLVSGKGSSTNPYSIGQSGTPDLNAPQSPSMDDILGVGLLLNSSTPPVEIDRAIYTDDMYQAVRVKDLTNALFTGLYYNPTFPNGSIYLWPVPNNSLNSLVLYRRQYLSSFADVNTTQYNIPIGYDEAIAYNLAIRLTVPYGRSMPDQAVGVAIRSLANLKRGNTRMSDLPLDRMFVVNRRSGYNIDTGTGG